MDLQALVIALERERLSRPEPIKERKPQPPSRKRWEARNPTLSFRTSAATRDLLKVWKEKADLSISDIVKVGLERLTQLELVNVLKTRISQEENTNP